MQLTLRETRRAPHGASRLVLAMATLSVKTRAPSRNCRGARVYSHTTSMHDNEYLPPIPSNDLSYEVKQNGTNVDCNFACLQGR